jgi:hypothetical protein
MLGSVANVEHRSRWNGTFLKKSDKSLNVFLKLAYHWTVRTPVKTVTKELDVSRATVIMW